MRVCRCVCIYSYCISFRLCINPFLIPTSYVSQELLKETHQEWANRVVELLYSIFCLDTQQITFTLLGHILLTDSAYWHSLADPPSKALAK